MLKGQEQNDKNPRYKDALQYGAPLFQCERKKVESRQVELLPKSHVHVNERASF